MTAKDIIQYLDKNNIKYRFDGILDTFFDGFCPLNNLKNNSITWIRNAKQLPLKEMNEHNNIILFAELCEQIENAEFPIIYVDGVYNTFFHILDHFFDSLNPENRERKIESTAIVETDCIGTGVYIGHHTYIGKDVKLGDNVTIMHNVTIDCSAEIGDNSFIESGTVIGACGFGYMTVESGKHEITPHFGGVKIGRNVRIGANNTIIRGCLSDTIIEDDVKTADLVCISHNDIIKQGVMITCGTVIAGSATVGENTWMAPGAVVSNGVEIGENAFIGIGSVVATKIRKNKKVFGNPAKYLE